MNLLYTMEDVAVYGHITPLKVKIIIALALTDSVVRDADVLTVRSPHSLRHTRLLTHLAALAPDFPSSTHGIPPGCGEPVPQAECPN